MPYSHPSNRPYPREQVKVAVYAATQPSPSLSLRPIDLFTFGAVVIGLAGWLAIHFI